MTTSRKILLSVALVAAALVPSPAHAAAAAADPADRGRDPGVQRRIDRLVSEAGVPGVIATVRGRDGRVRSYTAGVGDLRDGSPLPADGHVRIASNTKMFTATVVLQLVAEGKVDLAAPVERYLPGVIRGRGGDGRRITVRQLLQQTSGLPDYDTIVEEQGGSLQAIARTFFEPHQLLDAALAERRHFRPGSRWEYSNTNYVVLGLLAQRVTGRAISTEITKRVIRPAGLRDTYWPRPGEQRLRGEHPRAYWSDEPGAPYEDITRMDPSLGWAAGQLVSTTSDLGRFMQALVGGELLPAAQLAEMRRTVRAPGFDAEPGWRYGLGLASHRLECGGLGWGHGGDIQGFETRNLVTDDGRWAVVAITALPHTLEQIARVGRIVEKAICAS